VQTDRPFQFQKRSRLVIRVHNEALTVAAMRISNEGRSPASFRQGSLVTESAGRTSENLKKIQ
jgi:hypothetical protein